MAAAIIPVIATLAPELINLITSLVHQHAPIAEQNNGAGTGPVKFADVLLAVKDSLDKALKAGQIRELPEEASLQIIIQAVVTSMKISGTLTSSTTVIANPQAVTLTTGQSLTISVK